MPYKGVYKPGTNTWRTVAACTAYGCSLHRVRLQPAPRMVAACTAYGCSLHRVWLQELLLREHFDEAPSGPSIREKEAAEEADEADE